MEQVFKQLNQNIRVKDPLIIELNRRQYWTRNYYDLTCMAGIKIDENYFIATEPFQNPTTPQSYCRIKNLRMKVKHTEYRLV
jgi:hypothetical protein